MREEGTEGVLARMWRTESPYEAERLRLNLEDQFTPNQMLRPGAGALARHLVEGIPDATAAGRVESWELLAQLAAGANPPTSALAEVVASTQIALRDAVPTVIELLASGSGDVSDYLAVDVLDAVLSFSERPLPIGMVSALKQFASRGPREAKRVRVILGDDDRS